MTPPSDTAVVATPGRRVPAWALGLGPLALVALLVAALFAFDLPGLERSGAPQEVLAVERTVLRPGSIEITVRNDGADAVSLAQVTVNDAFIPEAAASPERVGRLATQVVRIPYDWIDAQAYEIALVTSTGATTLVEIEAAAETPARDAGFLGLMALLGIYVGVIPVAVGMLWLPFVRRVAPSVVRFLLAATVGLLAFLAVDALIEGIDVGGAGPQALGGAGLALLGAIGAYVALSSIDAHMASRAAGSTGLRLALLIAVGIGLHNLGEGLAIGSAYALGELALGAFLVVGFALHNTTEGLAIVAPVAHDRPGRTRLLGLGLVAGAPAILGTWIGGAAYSPALGALLLGVGAGAIVRVIVQITPSIRARRDQPALTPLTGAGVCAGLAVMYATSLMIAG